jgi:hypothetical protein
LDVILVTDISIICGKALLAAGCLALARDAMTPSRQSLELTGLAKIQAIARKLEDALASQDVAFQRHDSERYADAGAAAEDARSALASIPALTMAEILAKAKALGPVPTATLTSLSKGESALVASIIRDVRRMAAHRADSDGA